MGVGTETGSSRGRQGQGRASRGPCAGRGGAGQGVGCAVRREEKGKQPVARHTAAQTGRQPGRTGSAPRGRSTLPKQTGERSALRRVASHRGEPSRAGRAEPTLCGSGTGASCSISGVIAMCQSELGRVSSDPPARFSRGTS